MGLLWSSVVYCLLLLIFLFNLTISASVIEQCKQKHNGPPCSKSEQLLLDCIVRSIHDSRDKDDIAIKITTKIGLWKSTRAKFCADWPKLKNKVELCSNDTSCKDTESQPDNLCKHNAARCNYIKYANCSIKAGMLQGKSLHKLQSKLCLETDLNRGLIPYYGPHLNCYQSSTTYSADITFPLDHYLQFCGQFNHSKVKDCVEEQLATVSSDTLFTDKTEFISDAKNHLHKTDKFCKALSKIGNAFLTNCRMKDVRRCMKKAFDRAKEETDPPPLGILYPVHLATIQQLPQTNWGYHKSDTSNGIWFFSHTAKLSFFNANLFHSIFIVILQLVARTSAILCSRSPL